MNIHPFRSSYNHSEALQAQPNLHSPSYTNTADSYGSNLNKSPTTFSTYRNRPTHSMLNKQVLQQNTQLNSKPQTMKIEKEPVLCVDYIQWNNQIGFFTSELDLKVQYSVSKQLEQNVCWKVVYLGSAYSEDQDQILCQFETEESQKASCYPQKRQFKLTVQPPKWNLISEKELFNVTAIIICVSYKGQQFLKIGYYVHYQLPTLNRKEKYCVDSLGNAKEASEKQEQTKKNIKTKRILKKSQKISSLKTEDPNRETQGKHLQSVLSRTVRTILADKPRVTKFQVDWEKPNYNYSATLNETENQVQCVPKNQSFITEYFKYLITMTGMCQ